jgi:hypothetical protein
VIDEHGTQDDGGNGGADAAGAHSSFAPPAVAFPPPPHRSTSSVAPDGLGQAKQRRRRFASRAEMDGPKVA